MERYLSQLGSTATVREHHYRRLLGVFFTAKILESNRGQVKGRKDAGYTVRAATLKGSYFVFPAEIQRFGSGGSRLFGWVVRKISASSLYPAPVSLLSSGTEEPPLAPFRPP